MVVTYMRDVSEPVGRGPSSVLQATVVCTGKRPEQLCHLCCACIWFSAGSLGQHNSLASTDLAVMLGSL